MTRGPPEEEASLAEGRGKQLRKYRLVLILPFVLSALLLAPLACIRRSSEVAMSLRVSRLSLVVGDMGRAGLLQGVSTPSLTIHGYRPVPLGAGTLDIATAYERDSGLPMDWRRFAQGTAVSIAPGDDLGTLVLQGVTINRVDVDSGSALVFSWHPESPRTLQVYLEGPGPGLQIACDKILVLSCDYCRVESPGVDDDYGAKALKWMAGRPQVLAIGGNPEATTLAVALAGRSGEANVPVREDLSFTRLTDQGLHSTVLGDGGRISLVELDDEPLEIREGDFVLLDELTDFRIRKLAINGGIEVEFYGRAGVLKTGPRNFIRNRLPSYLIWIYARKSWLVYLNGLVLLATTTLSILKQLRLVAKEA